MTDKQLKIFISIADCGSFSKAEEMTFLSKQALIKQINTLEFELGFPLFVRTQKGCILTVAGEEYYRGAKEILKLNEEVTERSRRLAVDQKLIRIAVPPHPKFMLMDAILEFGRRYPNVRLTLTFSRGDQIINDILAGNVDVGERILNDYVIGSGLAYMVLTSLSYYCVMLKTHPMANRKKLTIPDLNGNLVGIIPDNQQELIGRIQAMCSDISLKPQTSDEMKSIYNICFNNGIFITKAYYAAYLEPLVCVPLDFNLSKKSVLVYRRDAGSEIRNFVKVAKEVFSSQ